MNVTHSDWNSKAGFVCSLPVVATVVIMSLGELGLIPNDQDSFWYGLAIWATALALPTLFFVAPLAIAFSTTGIRRQRTGFALVALLMSTMPVVVAVISISVLLLLKFLR